MEPGYWEAVLALLGLGGGAAGGIGTHRYMQGRSLGRVETRLDGVDTRFDGIEDRLDELLHEVRKVRRVAYRTQARLSKVETLLKVRDGGTAVDVLGEELPP